MKLTNGLGADFIIDGVGKTTFPGDLKAAAMRGNIVIYGAASGPADPVSPNSYMPRALTVSGGTLFNYILTREELLMRANAVIDGIKQGWLNLKIDETVCLENAAEAHQKLEGRQSSGKILIKVS